MKTRNIIITFGIAAVTVAGFFGGKFFVKKRKEAKDAGIIDFDEVFDDAE